MITGLHHYALGVPDLAVADDFLTGFGLDTSAVDGQLVARCPGRDQDQVRMIEAPTKRVHHVSFSVSEQGLDELRDRLQSAGVAEIEAPDGASGGGIWVRDPDGNAVQLQEAVPAPARAVPDVLSNIGGTYARFNDAAWLDATDVLPRRLGHMLLFTADPAKMTEFYSDVLGLGISDRIHNKVTFLNAGPGDHHVFGFIASTHRGFHHASYEVPSIDAIGKGAMRMHDAGWSKGWGLGRHTVGSNFFHYTQDPWGSWIEWFSDIDQIDECWTPGEWDAPPHLWGPPPPSDFITNQEQLH